MLLHLIIGIPLIIRCQICRCCYVIIALVIIAFLIIIGYAPKHRDYLGDNALTVPAGNWTNLMRASFITIFAFTGFQSVVQLSEETVSRDIIPKSITASVIFTTIFYALVIISVISIIGLKKASATVYPILKHTMLFLVPMEEIL